MFGLTIMLQLDSSSPRSNNLNRKSVPRKEIAIGSVSLCKMRRGARESIFISSRVMLAHFVR